MTNDYIENEMRREYELSVIKMEQSAKKEEERLNAYGMFDRILDQASKIRRTYGKIFHTRKR